MAGLRAALALLGELTAPLLLLLAAALAAEKGEDVYAGLTAGAKKGLELTVRLFPALAALFPVLWLFRASGLPALLEGLLNPVFAALGIPAETALLLLLRPFSGGGALSAAGITLDPAKMTVTADGNETALTAKECRLLLCLMRNKNTVLSREALLNSVWGFGAAVEPRAVDAQVKLLRKKLGKRARAIRTVIGAGYVFQEDRV